MGENSHLENEREEEKGSSSAEEGKVALPAAHLAAHGGQHVINVSSGQLRAWAAAAAAAEVLQAVLFSCWQTCNDKTQQMLKKTFTDLFLFSPFSRFTHTCLCKCQSLGPLDH